MPPALTPRRSIVPIGVDTACFPAAAPRRRPAVASAARRQHQPRSRTIRRCCARCALVIARGLDVHLDIVGEDTLDGAHAGAGAHAAARRSASRSMDFSRPTARGALRARTPARRVVASRSGRRRRARSRGAGAPTVGTAVGYVADWNPDRAVARAGRRRRARSPPRSSICLQDPARRERIAAAARAWTLAHDADWTAEQFEQIYREVSRAGLEACTTPD